MQTHTNITAPINDNSLVPAAPRGFAFEGLEVRAIVRDGDPWFVLTDVCRVLEHTNPSMAADRLDADERTSLNNTEGVPGFNGAKSVNLINESGLYSLILTSRKEAAKRFKKWVTSEVLPAIRKTGSYGQPARDPLAILNDPAAMRGLLLNYSEKVLALEATVSEQKPVVDAYDRLVTRTDGTMCITDAAKSIQARPKDLFAWLQRHRWIYRRPGGSSWLAYQSTLLRGYMEHKVTTITVDGVDRIREQALVTAKGLARLAVEFAKQEAGK